MLSQGQLRPMHDACTAFGQSQAGLARGGCKRSGLSGYDAIHLVAPSVADALPGSVMREVEERSGTWEQCACGGVVALVHVRVVQVHSQRTTRTIVVALCIGTGAVDTGSVLHNICLAGLGRMGTSGRSMIRMPMTHICMTHLAMTHLPLASLYAIATRECVLDSKTDHAACRGGLTGAD